MLKRIYLASVSLFGMAVGFVGDLWGIPQILVGICLAVAFGLIVGARLWWISRYNLKDCAR